MLVEVTSANGVIVTYDDEIVVGSVITAYHAGYWRVTKVTHRPGATPHFNYEQLLRADGSKAPKRNGGCDAAYCSLFDKSAINKQHDDQHKAADDLYDTLMGFLE